MLGAGAWGTAIAAALSSRHEVRLWARDPAQAERLSGARRNERYLPGIDLPDSLGITPRLDKAIEDAVLVLGATPVAGLRELGSNAQ